MLSASPVELEYKSPRFAPPTMLIAFVVIMLSILYLIFPKEAILEKTLSTKRADELSVAYLSNLLTKDPNNEQLRIKLTEQKLQQGDWAKAQQTLKPLLQEKINNNLKWQSEWLKYEIQRSKTLAEEKDLTHAEALEQLRNSVNQLAQAPLKNDALNALAQDALSLNMPKVAVSVYKRMISSGDEFDGYWYANAGRIALSTQDYRFSSNLFLEAYQRATTVKTKREYFLSALRSLQAGNKSVLAMKIAHEHLHDLENDRQTLVFLTRLALAANQPHKAQSYIEKIMQLNANRATNPSTPIVRENDSSEE